VERGALEIPPNGLFRCALARPKATEAKKNIRSIITRDISTSDICHPFAKSGTTRLLSSNSALLHDKP